MTDLGYLLRHNRAIWTGLGKSGYTAALLAATAATAGLRANHIHAEDLLHGELSTLQKDDVLIAVSWSAKSGQITELLEGHSFTTVVITSAQPGDVKSADYTLTCRPVSDEILGGIPAESVLETLMVGYRLIAAATTPAECVAALRTGHPHGAIGAASYGRRADSAQDR
jgi:D-arabinose 5-phosphate isomerase GutQ